jgi:Domain of unknown function (DUF5671)
MSATRRVYLYLLAFAGLAMLALGVANLGEALLAGLLEPGTTATFLREQVSRSGAAALVGLPVWALHWHWAQRGAAANPDERASTLRRLYLYAVLAGAVLAMAAATHQVIRDAIDGQPTNAVERLPTLAVGLVVWTYHWRVAARDRDAVGETGGSATLRRWYTYGAAGLGFVLLLDGTRLVVEGLWLTLIGVGDSRSALVGGPASALVGLALWLSHWWALPRALGAAIDEDRRGTLRSVYLFLGLLLVVGGSLVAASQLLYYALARLLGVEEPAGVGGNLAEAAAGPTSTLLVYGVGWAYQRRAIQEQARTTEAPRQAGVRRFYRYLVALVSLGAWSAGAAGLLWTLADALTQAPGTVTTGWWRDGVALFGTLAIVGLPVWLLHWTPVPADAAEQRSFARRLYLYLTLIGSVLALLGSAASAAYRLLSLTLGATPAGVSTDLAHALAVAAVAALLAAYHWQALRRATGAAEPEPGPPAGPVPPATVLVRLRAAEPGALASALAALRTSGLDVELVPEPGETASAPDGLERPRRDVLGEQPT